MTRTMRLGLALVAALLVVLVAVPVKADSHPDGYVNNDGYTWNNGYWWKDTYAYKYEKYWVAGSTYLYNGCYYTSPGYWAYKYVQYPTAAYKKPAEQVDYTDPDWRTKLLEIAGNRDKYEAQGRKAAYEQKAFLDSVQALGLQGNFRWEGYGTAPPAYGLPAAHGAAYSYGAAIPLNGVFTYGTQYQLGTHGVQGNTVYGSTYQQLQQLYGDNSLPQLFQQANRLAENAQRLSGQATTDFSLLVQQEGGNRARVAEILARAEAVKQFMTSLDGPPQTFTQQKSFEFRSDAATGPAQPPAPAGDPNYLKTAPNPRKQQFESVFASRCAACHTGAAAKGKFTLDAYYGMTPDEKLKVWQTLVTKDKDRMMPRKADGTPGDYIPFDEVKLFTEN